MSKKVRKNLIRGTVLLGILFFLVTTLPDPLYMFSSISKNKNIQSLDILATAPSGPWDEYNLAPSSKIVQPTGILKTSENVINSTGLIDGGITSIGPGGYVILDFGKEVGGFTKLHIGPDNTAPTVALTYSEWSTYATPTNSDRSNGDSNNEPPLIYKAPASATIDTSITQPINNNASTTLITEAIVGTNKIHVADTLHLSPLTKISINGEIARISSISNTNITLNSPLTNYHSLGSSVWLANSQLRGGFRYLTISNPNSNTLTLDNISVEITFSPNMNDLRAYPNYFYSNDNLINRIWYAGAYTIQTNIIANDTGRIWNPAPKIGWNNSAVVGELGDTVLVDGAKRDRTVWPGDLGISVPVDFVSLGDMVTIKNSLQTLYNHQHSTGALPYAGPAVNFIGNSDTYHMWTLIGTSTYYQYSGDKAWLDQIWPSYTRAIQYITAKIDDDGLMNVTSSADWARQNSGGKNIQAQAIMYRTLTTCAATAAVKNDTTLSKLCAQKAVTLKNMVNLSNYWDASASLYRDTPTSNIYPQDGNSLAVWFELTPSLEINRAISSALKKRWVSIGAPSPEKSDVSIHPFPGSMEAMAHFEAGQNKTGLDLLRLEWGYMLNSPYGTGSTFWEGYRKDGSSDYNESYISASHGWSAGPTATLTFYVLGIHPDRFGGPTYDLIPHPGDLKHVEGQLATPNGLITFSYDSNSDAGIFISHYSAPPGVLRTVAVPTYGRNIKIYVDGNEVIPNKIDDSYAYFNAIPGKHSISTTPIN